MFNLQILEFIQGIVIFRAEASKRGTWTAEDDHLAKIMEIIGPFPRSFINKGRRAAEFFDEQGMMASKVSMFLADLMQFGNRESPPNPGPGAYESRALAQWRT